MLRKVYNCKLYQKFMSTLSQLKQLQQGKDVTQSVHLQIVSTIHADTFSIEGLFDL